MKPKFYYFSHGFHLNSRAKHNWTYELGRFGPSLTHFRALESSIWAQTVYYMNINNLQTFIHLINEVLILIKMWFMARDPLVLPSLTSGPL